ncbi:LytTR family DNA-binding domain-containing protein [Clostridium sp. AWRP]|uniref:LytR/AlgR family response regulator transcription factor n=1 Tax=Clostridium sp. AWRP TaxID=2212991 RepID=UPI000FD81ACC|nr:LytTR family DNA-binding domain-containing protein [Clostridium sp. AWRP]AZV56368.1 response regulator [Clostridium sp. AWRP]
MNIAICDSLESDIQVLIHMIKKYCTNYNFEIEIFTYKSGDKLLSDFTLINFQLIFLDIYIDDKIYSNGIEIAKQIRVHDEKCIIVFVTRSKNHALDAFEVDAMQYLIKPVSYDKIKCLLDKCQNMFSDNIRFIEVYSKSISMKILLKDIYYIEVYNKICLIHTNTHVIKTYSSLKKLCDLLSGASFLRCHRSYIINMFYITSMLEIDFLLKNGDKVPIRKDRANIIKQIYSDYCFEQIKSGKVE